MPFSLVLLFQLRNYSTMPPIESIFATASFSYRDWHASDVRCAAPPKRCTLHEEESSKIVRRGKAEYNLACDTIMLAKALATSLLLRSEEEEKTTNEPIISVVASLAPSTILSEKKCNGEPTKESYPRNIRVKVVRCLIHVY